jgi:hypothetical protein
MVRTGQQEQDRGTGEPREDSQNRTAGTAQKGEDGRARQPDQERENRPEYQHGQDSWDRTIGTENCGGQPRQAARIGKSGQDN